MNSVTTVVKNAMFGAPNVFPSRLSVLSFIFLNSGGGYYWNKKGEADCAYGMPTPATTMNMTDLNELMAMTRKSGAGRDQQEHMNFQLAELKLQKLQRKHIADHIDLYANNRNTFDDFSLSDVDPLSMTSNLSGTLLGSLSQVKKLNKDWAMAADEIATISLKAVKKAKADKTLPPHMKGMEAALVQALDTLEPVTHVRANTAKAALALKGIWDELGMDQALGL